MKSSYQFGIAVIELNAINVIPIDPPTIEKLKHKNPIPKFPTDKKLQL